MIDEEHAAGEETLNDIVRRIYLEDFGFLPTNRSMKPVHVANGTARYLLERSSDHLPLARVLRQFVQNQRGGYLQERDSGEDILRDYPDQFAGRANPRPLEDDLTRLRALLNQTLGADGAVFHDMASFTLSNEKMVSADASDNRAGELLGALLRAPISEPPEAASLFLELLRSEEDPWTVAASPMLSLAETRPTTAAGAHQLLTIENGELTSYTLRRLRTRYDQLARYERARGSKLATLRRLILFGVFALHVHMVHRLGDVTITGPRPIILPDMLEGRRKSLRDASAASLQGGFRAMEKLVLLRIEETLRARFSVSTLPKTLPDDPSFLALADAFDSDLAATDPNQAWTDSVWRTAMAGVGPKSVGGYPWNTLLALGRRAGYLTPYDDRGRGGKEHKRYGIPAEFAEILVASVVDPSEPLDFDEFLDRLRDDYSIVFGRASDFEIIRRNDLRALPSSTRSMSVNENDLRRNVQEFRDLVIDIGFGKTYADGRTIVTTGSRS